MNASRNHLLIVDFGLRQTVSRNVTKREGFALSNYLAICGLGPEVSLNTARTIVNLNRSRIKHWKEGKAAPRSIAIIAGAKV
tara:strand:- start:557 stop:802 length:246 start_codon:yes stop_codon:yes gene_type:complete